MSVSRSDLLHWKLLLSGMLERIETALLSAPRESAQTSNKVSHTVADAEEVFLQLVRSCEMDGEPVSPKPGKNFAPHVFSVHPNSRGIGKERFRKAMESLIVARKVVVTQEGPPSRKRIRLVAA